MNGQCNPLNGGCRALAKAVGDLRNEKASKDFVDARLREIEDEMKEHVEKLGTKIEATEEALCAKLDTLRSWCIGIVVTFLLTAVGILGRLALDLLRG